MRYCERCDVKLFGYDEFMYVRGEVVCFECIEEEKEMKRILMEQQEEILKKGSETNEDK